MQLFTAGAIALAAMHWTVVAAAIFAAMSEEPQPQPDRRGKGAVQSIAFLRVLAQDTHLTWFIAV